MDKESEEAIKTIKDFKSRIHQMDDRVRRYLKDRKRNPHPGHDTLIQQIHQFERRAHRLPNRDVQFWLDGLMHSLMVYQRIWQRAFETGGGGYTAKSASKKNWENDIPIDKLYRAAQHKWEELGVSPSMTKEEMLAKVRPQYEKAMAELKEGERITWSINKKTNELHVQVKKEE